MDAIYVNDYEDFDGNEAVDSYIERIEAEESGHFLPKSNKIPNLIELALQLNLTTCVTVGGLKSTVPRVWT